MSTEAKRKCRENLKKSLRECGIVNTHDLLTRFGAKRRTDIAVSYMAPVERSVLPARTHVWSPSHKTDPKASWYDYQNKSFLGRSKESVTAAIKWASEKYGITDWAYCPTDRSTRIPAEVRAKAVEFAKESKSFKAH